MKRLTSLFRFLAIVMTITLISQTLFPAIIEQPVYAADSLRGNIITGNDPGDTVISVQLGSIPVQGSAQIIFEVTINDPIYTSYIGNQATITGVNILTGYSDDPRTNDIDDPTYIAITPSQWIAPVPGLSTWGIALMVLLFGGASAWLLRKRFIRR